MSHDGLDHLRMVSGEIQRDGGAAAVPEDPRCPETVGAQHGARIIALLGYGHPGLTLGREDNRVRAARGPVPPGQVLEP